MEQIDDRLFFSYLSNLVTGTFDAVIAAAETGKPMTSVVKWSDVELALYLLHIHKGWSMPTQNSPHYVLNSLFFSHSYCRLCLARWLAVACCCHANQNDQERYAFLIFFLYVLSCLLPHIFA